MPLWEYQVKDQQIVNVDNLLPITVNTGHLAKMQLVTSTTLATPSPFPISATYELNHKLEADN